MEYLHESFEEFINEFAMTPEEKKARRKERRAARKAGVKLPRKNSKNKAASLTPEELLSAIKAASPSYRLEWDHWGSSSFDASTGERGPRTDHGGGPDGDGWMDDYQLQQVREPYVKRWKSKMDKMVKDLAKKGIQADWYLDYGEKGHISLNIEVKQ